MSTPDERHEDQGREARHAPKAEPKRFRPEHATIVASVIMVVLGGGGFATVKDVSAQLEQQRAGRIEEAKTFDKKLESAGDKLDKLHDGLVKIEAHGDSSDKASDRVTAELGRVTAELREVSKTAERVSTRLDEHERRITALEGRK